MKVFDEKGEVVGFLEGDKLQDVNGKTLAHRRSSEREALKLSEQAAHRMNGRLVRMDLAPLDVETPTTQFTVGLSRPDFVADLVSPVRYVKHIAGKFFAENVSDQIQLVEASGQGVGGAAFVNPGVVSTSFSAQGYALAAKLPRNILGNADFDVKAMAVRRLVTALRLGRENRVQQLLTTQANWASGNVVTVGATSKWNGGTGTGASTPNPLNDMKSALKVSYLPANVMILSEGIDQYFYVQPQASTGIRDYVQGGGEMPERLIARAKVLMSGVPAYAWSQATAVNVALVRVASDENEIGTTITCRWLGEAQDGERTDGMLARSYHLPSEDCEVVVVAHNDAEVFLSNQVGALIVGAIQ